MGRASAGEGRDRSVKAPAAVIRREFFVRKAIEVAPQMIGCTLLFDGVGGRIVEVEAYDQNEPASHSHGGETPRTRAMFGPAGSVYVYRSYGLHWCMNVVCEDDRASAVLIRALEPLSGLALMKSRRGRDDPHDLCAGPGRLCQALGVSGDDDGASVLAAPFVVKGPPDVPEVVAAPRIGISKATELPWRFCERDSPFLSRAVPRGSKRG